MVALALYSFANAHPTTLHATLARPEREDMLPEVAGFKHGLLSLHLIFAPLG
jgi:hypothetical protein